MLLILTYYPSCASRARSIFGSTGRLRSSHRPTASVPACSRAKSQNLSARNVSVGSPAVRLKVSVRFPNRPDSAYYPEFRLFQDRSMSAHPGLPAGGPCRRNLPCCATAGAWVPMPTLCLLSRLLDAEPRDIEGRQEEQTQQDRNQHNVVDLPTIAYCGQRAALRPQPTSALGGASIIEAAARAPRGRPAQRVSGQRSGIWHEVDPWTLPMDKKRDAEPRCEDRTPPTLRTRRRRCAARRGTTAPRRRSRSGSR